MTRRRARNGPRGVTQTVTGCHLEFRESAACRLGTVKRGNVSCECCNRPTWSADGSPRICPECVDDLANCGPAALPAP